MDCRKLERYLDEHGPDLHDRALLDHAARCPSCTAAVHAAREVEAALREAAGHLRSTSASAEISAGLTDRLMARIDAVEEHLAAARAREMPKHWSRWLAPAADPLVTVSLTLAMVLALLWAWHPGWAGGLTEWAALWLDRGAGLLASPGPAAGYLREGLAAALAPAAVWLAWRFLRLLRRALVLRAIRPGV